MSTLAEDLERVSLTLGTVTDHHIDSHDGAVYVNFGYAEALVIEPEITEHGKTWNVSAMAWDQTHGVSADLEVGSWPEDDLAEYVRLWLNEQDAAMARLEIMATIPDED